MDQYADAAGKDYGLVVSTAVGKGVIILAWMRFFEDVYPV